MMETRAKHSRCERLYVISRLKRTAGLVWTRRRGSQDNK